MLLFFLFTCRGQRNTLKLVWNVFRGSIEGSPEALDISKLPSACAARVPQQLPKGWGWGVAHYEYLLFLCLTLSSIMIPNAILWHDKKLQFNSSHFMFYVNVPLAFINNPCHPPSPPITHCYIFVYHPAGRTRQMKLGLVDGCLLEWYRYILPSANDGLPSTPLCRLIPEGVWAGSNDPPWQPSHAAETPLIFTDMPADWRAAWNPVESYSLRVRPTFT